MKKTFLSVLIFLFAILIANVCLAEDLQPGDSVFIGEWMQIWDTYHVNAEPIEWIVLAVEDERALLLSRYALDVDYLHEDPFHKSNSVAWESSGTRVWLNRKFFEAAFSEQEKERILEVTNNTPDNSKFGTAGGNDTKDRIFCLSIEEVEMYMDSDTAKCEMTDYLQGYRKLDIHDGMVSASSWIDDEEYGYIGWRLRTTGKEQNYASYVNPDGTINFEGIDYGHFAFRIGFRPAMWISLNSENSPEPVQYSKLHDLYKMVCSSSDLHMNYQISYPGGENNLFWLSTSFVEPIVSESPLLVDMHTNHIRYYRSVLADEKTSAVLGSYGSTKYVLSPDDKTGTVTHSFLRNFLLAEDNLYRVIMDYSNKLEWYEESREFDGVPCLAEVYTDLKTGDETAYCFGDEGQLLYVLETKLDSDGETIKRETLFKVNAIDENVDESLFDISDYTISDPLGIIQKPKIDL